MTKWIYIASLHLGEQVKPTDFDSVLIVATDDAMANSFAQTVPGWLGRPLYYRTIGTAVRSTANGIVMRSLVGGRQ